MIKKEYIIIMYRLMVQYTTQLFKQSFLLSLASMGTWGGISLYITGRVLPHMGMTMLNFGLMQFSGIISGIAMQVSYRDIFPYIMDFEDKKNIYHEIGYPIPSQYLFLSKFFSHAIFYFFVAISLIPLCKLILWDDIILSSFHLSYFLISLFSACLLFSAMVFFIVSFINHIRFAGLAWSFFIFPLWFLGGFQFSWNYLYNCNKYIALLDLLNPIIYINESLKIAIMKISSFLPFFLHIFIILSFTVIFFMIGTKRIKKKLDII